MIKIDFYNNGMEINGHSDIVTCSEISMFAWFLQGIIWEVDNTSYYYASASDNSQNPNEGRTKFTFNKNNEKALWTFEMFRDSMKYFRKHKIESYEWGNSEVVINYIDADLS